jgi:multiple sugar transport system ATP-binding protein
LRVQMRAQLTRLHERLGTTTIFVTHDQVEAMTLGQRVAVLKDGVVQQVDTPQNLYNHPSNLFVAAFIGSPPMNLVEAKVSGSKLSFAGEELPLDPATDLKNHDGRNVILGIRPSDLEDCDVWRNDSLPTIEVIAEVTEELGSEVNVVFHVDSPAVRTEDTRAAADVDDDEDGSLIAEAEDKALFTARVDARTKATPGDKIRLSVDPARFHFFEPSTGIAIEANRPVAASAG